MAYSTGATTGPNDLLDKFRLFAESQGWTTNRNVAAGSGREVCISKGSAYFNFRAIQNETFVINGRSIANRYGVALNGSDGYSGGSAWDRQPGYSARTPVSGTDQAHAWIPTMMLTTGSMPAYHFFAPDSKTLYCELEVVTGIFMRFGCGSLDLLNPAAPGGGRFFYANCGCHSIALSPAVPISSFDVDNQAAMEMVPFRGADYIANILQYTAGETPTGSMVRAAFGSFDGWAGSGRTTTIMPFREVCQGGGCHDKLLRDLAPAPLNGIAVLASNMVSLNIANEYLSPIGVVPGQRQMDMTNFLPGEEFSFGGDTWKVFPWFQKGSVTSLTRGIAYKKVP